MPQPIPDEVRRFLLTSIPTVPHLETLLLLWREPDQAWPVESIAARLYVSLDRATRLVNDLCQAQFLDKENTSARYRFRREPALVSLLSCVDAAHSRRLREVTALIHANTNGRPAPFAPASCGDA
jgi:hypothetical protein